MADSATPRPPEVDPRRALAQKYMQKAHAELEAKEQEKPRERKPPRTDEPTQLADLVPSIEGATYVHVILVMPLAIFSGLAFAWCYGLLDRLFVLGRIMALPVGVLVILTLSYLSAIYLGVIESTSHGTTTPEDALRGDWRDWFWSLPMTVGMLFLAALVGYVVSLLFPQARWEVVAGACWLLYPLLQLSCLETGSPAAPLSPPVLATLFTRPLMWMTIYASTFVLCAGLLAVSKAVYRDPPVLTIVVVAPLSVFVVFAYGLILGTAARWLSLKGR